MTNTGSARPELRQLPLPMQISQLHSALNAQARTILSNHGPINLAQWRIVRLVGLGAADTSTAVRKIVGIDKSQFSKELTNLVKHDFVKAATYERDKRQQHLELTVKGRTALDQLLPVLAARHAHLMQALSHEQQTLISDAIEALGVAAQKTNFEPIDQTNEDA